MASISVTEQDYETLCFAAFDARDKGDQAQATKLDVLARKISASLSSAKHVRADKTEGLVRAPLRWTDVPSILTT